jgi:hypothetical protein
MSGRKTILLIAAFMACFFYVFVAASDSMAASREYPYIYKSPRVLGMGGVDVAIGGKFDSVFYNPAGLGRMPDKDWEVNVLGLTGAYGEDTKDFTDAVTDAVDVGDKDNDGDEDDDQIRAVNEVLDDFKGENMYLRADNLSSVAKRYGELSFGAGGLAGLKLDAAPHQGMGADGFLEMDMYVQYGAIVGVGFNPMEGLSLGAAVKYLDRETVDHFFSAREIVENEDDLEGYFEDELVEDGSAVGFDLGVIYEFFRDAKIKPAVGLSIMDIGDTDFGTAGEIPMTFNLGVSASAEVPVIKSVTVGLDYVDMFNNFEEDDDFGKRLRMGAEFNLYDGNWIGLTLRTGLYQGYGTLGADVRVSVVNISYVTYAEEIGAYSGQDDNRRHVLAFNVGW